MANDIEVIYRHRQCGKTTALMDDMIDTLDGMRVGRIKRGSIGVIVKDHDQQKHFLREWDRRLEEEGIDLKRDEHIYVANERSAASFDGMRFRRVFVDNVDLFDHGVDSLVIHNAMVRSDTVVVTATPDYTSTVDLLKALEIQDEREREREASRLKREAEEREHQKMMVFMLGKIAEAQR